MENKLIIPVALALMVLISLPFVGMAGATPRVVIGETDLIMDSYKTPTAATAISANQHAILASKDNRLMLVVTNTAAHAGLNVTVLKGVYFRSGLGNLTLTVPKSSTRFIGPLESSRFEDAAGNITVNFNNTAGTVTGYRLPSS
jgi:P pilus assembly chaperone PapD